MYARLASLIKVKEGTIIVEFIFVEIIIVEIKAGTQAGETGHCIAASQTIHS